MLINVINNNIHNCRNFIIYHFLVENKPHERIDLLIIASMNIYQKKLKKNIPIVMKTCFTEKN